MDVGISPRALRIARYIDRLTEGEYQITLSKRRIEAWYVEIDRTENVRRVELDK